MDRLKTFGKYLILFLLFYLFVSFISYGFVRSSLKPMQQLEVSETTEPEITVKEAKSSKTNGYIKGNVKNNTSEDIKDKYVKVDLISKQNNVITSRYSQIDSLKAGESKDFKINFNAENIKTYRMNIVDQMELSKFKIQMEEFSNMFWGLFLVWILFL